MHVLVVERDAATSKWLENHLAQWHHTATAAPDAPGAFKIVAATRIDMVIAAMPLPDARPDAFCRRIRELSPNHRPFLLLLHDPGSDDDATPQPDSGLDDWMAKPVDPDRLRIKVAIATRMLALEQDLDRKMAAIRRNYYQSMHALSQLINHYSDDLGAHCRRVGRLAVSLAKRHPEASAEDYPVIEAAGTLHDIGMVGLPEPVLRKRRTELVGNESLLYRSHAERGEAILKQMDLFRPVARLVRMHHEQHNGRGFPDGAKGNRIPLGAAIVAAASLYDDLVHRDKISLKKIPEHLQRYRGYQLRPDLVGLLLEANLSMMQEETRRTDQLVSIDDLTAGMVLAREVHMKSGAFCMAVGTVVEKETIQKLKRYHEMGNISAKVFVNK